MLDATILVLAFSVMVLIFLMIKGPTVWDRLIILNLMTLKLAMIIVVFSVLMNSQIMLDVAMTYSIIGFLSVCLLSRFLLKGGRLR